MKTKLHPVLCAIPIIVLVVITSGKKANAQEKKEEIRTVTISKGDTIINGKELSKLGKAEREKLRKELREMEKDFKSDGELIPGSQGDKDVVIIKKKRNSDKEGGKDGDRVQRRYFRHVVPGKGHVFKFDEDDVLVDIHVDSIRPLLADSLRRFHGRVLLPRDFTIPMPNAVPRVYTRPGMPLRSRLGNNAQSFNFHNRDKDGIATNISISVSDAGGEKVKELTGQSKAALEVQDLAFAPQFSSGKISILFALASKGTAEVKLYDSSKKVLFSEKTSTGGFAKTVSLPKNGVYFLVVKQGNQFAVKRIVKES